MTFQVDFRNFHIPQPRSPVELLPNRVISTVVSPGSRSRARAGARGGTPGTAAAAVRFDIQGWLIYGAGETVPLLWVFTRRRPWQVSLLTYSIIKLRSQQWRALVCDAPTAAAG